MSPAQRLLQFRLGLLLSALTKAENRANLLGEACEESPEKYWLESELVPAIQKLLVTTGGMFARVTNPVQRKEPV